MPLGLLGAFESRALPSTVHAADFLRSARLGGLRRSPSQLLGKELHSVRGILARAGHLKCETYLRPEAFGTEAANRPEASEPFRAQGFNVASPTGFEPVLPT